MTRPGDDIRAMAARVFPCEIMESVIDPIVADMQCEYGDALVRAGEWRARLTLVRSYAGLAGAVIRLGARYICDPRSANPGSEVARTWMVSVLAWGIFTVALVLPALLSSRWWDGDVFFGAVLSLTLVPQALPLSIPAGLCVAVLLAGRGKEPNSRRLWTVLGLALLFTIVVWGVLEWAVPQGNQSFREMVAARLAGREVKLEPGLNELGLSRLGRRSDPEAVWHYHVLWAISFAAVPLGLLAFGFARYVRRAPSAVALAIALFMSYSTCVWTFAERPLHTPLPLVVEAWLPNMAFLFVAGVVLLRHRRSSVA
jgi:hypothetical protein